MTTLIAVSFFYKAVAICISHCSEYISRKMSPQLYISSRTQGYPLPLSSSVIIFRHPQSFSGPDITFRNRMVNSAVITCESDRPQSATSSSDLPSTQHSILCPVSSPLASHPCSILTNHPLICEICATSLEATKSYLSAKRRLLRAERLARSSLFPWEDAKTTATEVADTILRGEWAASGKSAGKSDLAAGPVSMCASHRPSEVLREDPSADSTIEGIYHEIRSEDERERVSNEEMGREKVKGDLKAAFAELERGEVKVEEREEKGVKDKLVEKVEGKGWRRLLGRLNTL